MMSNTKQSEQFFIHREIERCKQCITIGALIQFGVCMFFFLTVNTMYYNDNRIYVSQRERYILRKTDRVCLPSFRSWYEMECFDFFVLLSPVYVIE